MTLPSWFDGYRPGQQETIDTIVAHFRAGKRVVMLDAPTGSGKTLIAESVRQALSSAKTLYLCTTKSLQDQFVHDFDYAAIIKGRDNYPTHDRPEDFNRRFGRITAADCTKRKMVLPACGNCTSDPDHEVEDYHCLYCHPWHACPYERVKWDALAASLAVTNVSYFLTETNRGRARFAGRDLVIIDEADRLEAELMSFVEAGVSKKDAKKYGIAPPKRKTVAAAWQEWITDEALPKLAAALSRIPVDDSPEHRRERKHIKETYDRLRALDVVNNRWVYTGYESGDMRFKPVVVNDLAPDLLWNKANRFLLMSATIISPDELADSLGIDDFALVQMPWTFPVERRPIIVRPVANMARRPTYKSDWNSDGTRAEVSAEEYKRRAAAEQDNLVAAVAQILADHPTERILIHAVSYSLAETLANRLTSARILWYKSSRERDTALERFRRTEAAVLIAPSLDRGIDLPHDACRVVVVAKVPFPDLSDKQVNARLRATKGGELWYAVQTARTLVQMTGRGMRAPDDYCTTYVLDSQFMRWHRQWGSLLPGGWKESLDFTGGVRARALMEGVI